jgi:mannose/fructose/N-acetylgalactosamine-specific phosphotransferase system component IIC
MSNRARGLVLIAAGALLTLVALGADALGLAAHPDFGWKQILATVVGVAVAVVGLRDLRR